MSAREVRGAIFFLTTFERQRIGLCGVDTQTFARRMMIKGLSGIHPLVFLIVATILEVSGDAVIRKGIYTHGGLTSAGFFVAGALLLFGYGSFLNLAPLEFGRVVGLYIATLFVIWQIISFFAFREVPTLPILVGGAFVIAGGAIITFWQPS